MCNYIFQQIDVFINEPPKQQQQAAAVYKLTSFQLTLGLNVLKIKFSL